MRLAETYGGKLPRVNEWLRDQIHRGEIADPPTRPIRYQPDVRSGILRSMNERIWPDGSVTRRREGSRPIDDGIQIDTTRRPTEPEIAELRQMLVARRTLVLTGAGISTESGIPDYRGPGSLTRRRRPIQFRDFMGSTDARKSYWARSSIGWPRVRDAHANAGHLALARLERETRIIGVLTQNVDGLHQKAGSVSVLELHGGLSRVICTECGGVEGRGSFQARINLANPEFASRNAEIAPDGDANLPVELVHSFSLPGCFRCMGLVKPDIVFFGENVPGERVSEAWEWLESAEALLVAGSSLTVYSGFRFVQRAAALGLPVAILNQGPTRGDELATVRIDGPTGYVLSRI